MSIDSSTQYQSRCTVDTDGAEVYQAWDLMTQERVTLQVAPFVPVTLRRVPNGNLIERFAFGRCPLDQHGRARLTKWLVVGIDGVFLTAPSKGKALEYCERYGLTVTGVCKPSRA